MQFDRKWYCYPTLSATNKLDRFIHNIFQTQRCQLRYQVVMHCYGPMIVIVMADEGSVERSFLHFVFVRLTSDEISASRIEFKGCDDLSAGKLKFVVVLFRYGLIRKLH